MKKKEKKGPTPKRKFTDSFALGDEVYVIRDAHGWYEGSVEGKITFLTDSGCTVTDTDGIEREIPRPRDIRKKMAW